MIELAERAIAETAGIPRDLDEMEPGPVLAAFLSAIDVGKLSEFDRIVVLRARAKMAAHYQAQIYSDVASVVDAYVDDCSGDEEGGADLASWEIRPALKLTRRAADMEVTMALDLRDRLPRVWDLLNRGELDLRRVRVIVDGTLSLSTESTRRVIDELLDKAPRLTTGQLRALIRKLTADADPEEAAERYEQAVEGRRVVAEADFGGTASIYGLDLPPHRVTAVTRLLNKLARNARGKDETRTTDQLRADVFLDLLLGKANNGKGAVVHLQADLESLAGLTEASGDLNGYGPVIADIARQVAEEHSDAEWRVEVTHPETGQPIHLGRTSRRPTAELRRRVQMRDRTCTFPGCRMPAVDCDLDHIEDWAHGGTTDEETLAPVCRNDHVGRHKAGWIYIRLPNGDYLWISPFGHRYTTSGMDPPET